MAAKNFGRVNVSITASTGGLTAGLSRASKQLGGFSGQAQGIGGRLTAMAAGFVGAGRSATIAAVGVKALGMAIKSLLGPLLIVTSLVALFARFGKTASDLDAAGKAARSFGLSMSSFQALSQAASEAGLNIEQLRVLMTFMTRSVGQLRNGSKQAQQAFAAIGLTAQDLAGLSPEQQLELISSRLMAIPNHAQRSAVAMQLFGEQGVRAFGLLQTAANGGLTEIVKLQQQLGISLTDTQVAGIEMMNDALARTSMVFQGFINQFVAELAPAITTVANLFVKFFAENASGFSMATTLASALGQAVRGVAGAVTFLYGAFQILSSFLGVFITGAIAAFAVVTGAIESLLDTMATAAESLPGFDTGLASGLRAAQQSVGGLSDAASDEADLWGQAAADNFANGVRNMSDPFAAFDAEFANVTAQMQQAGAAAGTAAGQGLGSTVSAAIRASGDALKAVVVGTGEGEAFRNAIARGADPRLEGDAAKETADNTGEMVDQLDELNGSLSGSGGFGLASISV